MRTTIGHVALRAVCLTSSVSAIITMHAQYSDNMINVGNLNPFAATWQTMYATDGNIKGVVVDKSYQTDQETCNIDGQKDTTVNVKMEGAWGVVGQASAANMRDAIMASMWKTIDTIFKQNQYQVFDGCKGTTWMDGVAPVATAACGPSAAMSCANPCAKVNTPTKAQCDTMTYGSKLPSQIKVTAYNDATLVADDLTVTFTAAANDVSNGGCGVVGVITKELATFIPLVGGLFATGIDLKCAN